MKRKVVILLLMICLIVAVISICAFAEGISTDGVPTPVTWQYLVTIPGTSAFTLIVVQFLKAPLDKLWKIPTRLIAYIISLAIMLVSTLFTSGLTWSSSLLVVFNALVAALTAFGAYEVTFKKIE